VSRAPYLYGAVRGLAAGLLALFYRRIEVVGLEHVPREGPVVVAANHQNALVDGMLLLTAVPRRLTALAKAPLFRHPLVGPFLALLGAVPVRRRQDAPAGAPGPTNEAMFAAAAATLERGGALLIFPEGVSQPEPVLQPLRTGAARIVLGAEAAHGGRLGVRLLPVALTYHEPGTFRTGWALVLVGEPVPTADCVALHARAPEEAVRRLTARLGQALRERVVEVGDRQTLRLVQVAEALWRAGAPAADPATSATWRRRLARAHRYLTERDPSRVAALRERLERLARTLERSRAEPRLLGRAPAPGAAARYALRQGLPLLLGLPLALWGLAVHGLPYQITRGAVALARPEADVEATWKLVAGLVLYPLCWGLEAGVAWRRGGAWGLAVFLLTLAPAGFFALAWAQRLGRLAREARAFLGLLRDRDLDRFLAAERQAILEEMARLQARVPEAVLEGREAAS
jgi:1-acyl-sn-glycerol-3-phosphate acyltransferase